MECTIERPAIHPIIAVTSIEQNRVFDTKNLRSFTNSFTKLSQQMHTWSAKSATAFKTLETKRDLVTQGSITLSEVKQYNADHKPPYKYDDSIIKFCNTNLPVSPNWSNTFDESQSKDLQDALDVFIISQTDFTAKTQINLQLALQRYNGIVALFSALQNLLSDITKSLIQAVR
jgi:hypothetical protein